MTAKHPRRRQRSQHQHRKHRGPATAPISVWRRAGQATRAWITHPQPVERLELARAALPLAILGFLSSRLLHATHWLSSVGLQIPYLGHPDYRQPLYLPPVPPTVAWAIAIAIVVAGLATALGAWTRLASAAFTLLLAYVTLQNRLEAFTVTKLGTVLSLGLFLSPCGARYSIDAWLARQRRPDAPERAEQVSGGSVRFFQIVLLALYAASGIAKMRGDWLRDPLVIWSHLHDSYQSAFAYFLALHLPAVSWTILQGLTLAYEALAPLWYSLRRTRPVALIVGLGMHLMIALLFPPVMWFSLLMITLITAGFAPAHWLRAAGALPQALQARHALTRAGASSSES